MRDEAPGIDELGWAASALGASPGCDSRLRSDQLRCCGNPSWTSVGRLHRHADRTATFKLRARQCRIKYDGISECSETNLETMKRASLPCSGQNAQKLDRQGSCLILLQRSGSRLPVPDLESRQMAGDVAGIKCGAGKRADGVGCACR